MATRGFGTDRTGLSNVSHTLRKLAHAIYSDFFQL